MGAIFLRRGSAHVDTVITKRCSKQPDGCPWRGGTATNHTVALRILPNPASGTYTSARRNSPETFRNLPPEPTIAHARTLRNLPELAPGTYTTPAHTGTLQNLPEPASGTYNSTRPNSPEPSGTCPRNVHYTSTHRNSPEPSGTCLRNLQ